MGRRKVTGGILGNRGRGAASPSIPEEPWLRISALNSPTPKRTRGRPRKAVAEALRFLAKWQPPKPKRRRGRPSKPVADRDGVRKSLNLLDRDEHIEPESAKRHRALVHKRERGLK
jgi:hypothetical protein